MHVHVLHKNKQYLEECVAVLNEEWPRSKTARIHSLEKSCDNFPVNLVLVDDKDVTIGHSRLSLVVGREKSCFIESVVVKKALRGKGLGKFLMQETEEFAKRAGFTTAYLTTHDKQDFYQHIGYQFCKPIVSCGALSPSLPQTFLDRLAATSLEQDQTDTAFTEKPQGGKKDPIKPPAPSIPPPPAAPPAPKPVSERSNLNQEISKWDPSEISWMKKDLV